VEIVDRCSAVCPLCQSIGADATAGADSRRYYRCRNCELIFVDVRDRISELEQRKHYLTHENGPHQAGYVAFLRRVIDPMLQHLDATMIGLDYGCGPGPAIAAILQPYSIGCTNYDPLFANDPLTPPYDYIFATECFEHFEAPGEEIRRLHGLLRPGGHLGIMTEPWTELNAFANWHYTRDPTHIAFYHARTFEYLCTELGFVRQLVSDVRVVILRRL
jgi:hypothetical protein